MNLVSTPLEMSAASIRLAGYMIESNLRVAQALGEAALRTNPFAVPADLRKKASASAPRPAKPAAKAVKKAASQKKTRQTGREKDRCD